MVKKRRNQMVNSELKYAIINSQEIINNKLRLEANVFNVDARKARLIIKNNKYGSVNLWSDKGLVKNAFYPTRFKRIYVDKENGEPMLLPSQMINIDPKPTKFISKKTAKNFNELKTKVGMLLVTRSGTIGNITLVSRTLNNLIMSDDVIRITFNNDYDLGYTYTFLKSKIGQTILSTSNYGSVIKHIEPEHFQDISIPNPPDALKERIHNKIIESYSFIDESNDLINKAEKSLINELQLPPIEEMIPEYFDNNIFLKNFSVKSNLINNRFDASYHPPLINLLFDYLFDNSSKVINLGSPDFTSKVFLPLRFKRIYVEEEFGTVFIGGKQILENNPSFKKYLSKRIHGDRILNQLVLHENMVLVTRSGTVGKVNIVPKHWENWVANDHVIRISAKNEVAGYLYIWLKTIYGKVFIDRLINGSVVDEIDDNLLSQIPVPILKNIEIQNEINNLALKANELRSNAYYLEQEAIELFNKEVLKI